MLSVLLNESINSFTLRQVLSSSITVNESLNSFTFRPVLSSSVDGIPVFWFTSKLGMMNSDSLSNQERQEY